jgi:Domain of unknown function (DUF4388)/PilZ domain
MRRRSERYELDLKVELFSESDAARVAVGDLSRSGMFLELDTPRPIGEQVHIAMFFEGRQLASAATIVHGLSMPIANALNRRPGNGVAFAPPTRHADALFLRAVDRLCAARAASRPQRVILRGQLSEIGLPAVLVMLEQERKSCRINVDGPYRAWIELLGGAIVAAGAEGRFGDPRTTVLDLLDWDEGQLEVIATTPATSGRMAPVHVTYLLLEHARLVDELRAVRN